MWDRLDISAKMLTGEDVEKDVRFSEQARTVKFTDPQLQTHVERAAAVITDLPDDLVTVCGLLDACQWFTLTEGENSPRVREAFSHLLSAELRPALRSWYQRFGDGMNPAAIEF